MYFCESIRSLPYIVYKYYCCFVKLKAFSLSLLEVIRHPPAVGTFCKSWAFPKNQICLVICGWRWGVCMHRRLESTQTEGILCCGLLHTHSHIHKCLGYEPTLCMHINTYMQLLQCDVGSRTAPSLVGENETWLFLTCSRGA